MHATTLIGPRSWRYDLTVRDRDFAVFPIPSEVIAACGVKANTKRLVAMRLSSGLQLRGYCSIRSGTKIYIPTEFRVEFQPAEWLECEIIGDDIGESVSLRRVAQ
jgi:hypothetical protein